MEVKNLELKNKKRMLQATTILMIFMLLIPVVSAGLVGYSVRIYKYQSGGNIRMKTSISAPFIRVRCTPPKSIKWYLEKRDVYGRYRTIKSGWSGYLSYRLKYGTLKATNNKYFYGLDLGAYRYRVLLYQNCAYTKEMRSKTFTVG